jgi:hypothetical protein
MGKKQIVVPKDSKAQRALDRDVAAPEDVIELTLSEREFHALLASGVFGAINRASGSSIDDFEDEGISGSDALSAAIDVLTDFQRGADSSLAEALRILLFLFQEAVRRNTEVHFFF